MQIHNNYLSYINLYPINNFGGTIVLPGSKSISNRILLLSVLSKNITIIKNLLISEDTIIMLNILKLLGIKLSINYINGNCIINGCNGKFPNQNNNLFIGNAGTVIRSLTSILAFIQGNYILFGFKKMYNRPIKDLIDVLNNIGMNIKYLNHYGYPPLYISNGNLNFNKIKIKCDISSQFLTSLLLSIGSLNNNKCITIKLIGNLISKPYVNMTINLMSYFGIKVKNINFNTFKIFLRNGYKSPGFFNIEGDATSASYFLAAGVITGNLIKIKGINKNSIQGDIKIINILRNMGGIINITDNYIESYSNGPLNSINVDCNDIPDAAMTIAIVALYTNNSSILYNISSWKFKETNRLLAMSNELNKLGAITVIGKDYIKITPPKFIKSAIINTYNDHRIAMCFSLVSLNSFIKNGSFIRINNPNCVYKTFPNYFKIFKNLSNKKKIIF